MIDWVEIEKLTPNPKNPYHHTPADIDEMVKIIKWQGWRHPIVTDKDYLIWAGHKRLYAAKKMGLQKVPVHVQAFDSHEQAYSFMTSDNELGKRSEIDLSMVNLEVGNLGPDFDIDLLAIKDFTIDIAEKLGDPDAVPEVPKEAKTKCGELWVLGDHRVLCGDATSKEDVERLVSGHTIDMVFTDPPYGIDVVKKDGNIGGTRANDAGRPGYGKVKCGVYKSIVGDDKPFDPVPLLALAPAQIIWGANNFASKLTDNSHWIVWWKEMPLENDFSAAELAWTNLPGKSIKGYKFTWAGMTRQGARSEELTNRVHPTQKPVGLFADILNDYEPTSVVDPYLGSGSTLIACEKTSRRCFGMEIEPLYIDVILTRWAKFTGRDPVREDGVHWSELNGPPES